MASPIASPILPPDFLLGPAPNLTKQIVDFKKFGLYEYHGLYAAILDGCLTKEECDLLARAAEVANGGGWDPALIDAGGGRQIMDIDHRNSSRIIWDERELVARIWNRVKGVLDELMAIDQLPRVFGKKPFERGTMREMTRLNERMRFLKYGAGQYFRPHCDSSYTTEDFQETAFFTLHLYLNESRPDVLGGKLEGGATTFHSPYDDDRSFDVVPKAGRILIFQQKDLIHSGAEVELGTKLTVRTELMYKMRD